MKRVTFSTVPLVSEAIRIPHLHDMLWLFTDTLKVETLCWMLLPRRNWSNP